MLSLEMHFVLLVLVVVGHLKATTATQFKLQDAVDLTWPFDNNTIYWKNSQSFIFTKQKAETLKDGMWYTANEFCAAEHGGTHFDAPYHTKKDGWKVGDVPLSRLIANGITVDVRNETKQLNDEAVLLPEHLEAWEKTHGPIPENSVILVKFGWAQHFYNKAKYMGEDKQGVLHFPGISADAAKWIADTGKVVGVGIDTPSVDPGKSSSLISHKLLSEHGIYNLENVKLPEEFPAKGFFLFVMPMKIGEGTGAPLRLIAIPTV